MNANANDVLDVRKARTQLGISDSPTFFASCQDVLFTDSFMYPLERRRRDLEGRERLELNRSIRITEQEADVVATPTHELLFRLDEITGSSIDC